jgi:hypothetical protein
LFHRDSKICVYPDAGGKAFASGRLLLRFAGEDGDALDRPEAREVCRSIPSGEAMSGRSFFILLIPVAEAS